MHSLAKLHSSFLTVEEVAKGIPRRSPVCLLINDLSGGGAQRRVVTLANRFIELGREVDLVAVEPLGPTRTLFAPRVRVVALAPDGAAPFLSPSIYANKLVAYLEAAQPSVLMSCVSGVHLLAVVASGRHARHVPLVLRASRHPYRAFDKWKAVNSALQAAKLLQTRSRYRRADAIVAVSSDTADGLRSLLKGCRSRVVTILNPVVPTRHLDFVERRTGRADGDMPIVLGVGRLVHQKDFATLLRAFAIVRSKQPARLVLLGEGPKRKELESLAIKLGISDDLEMPGAVDDVVEWMRRADVLVSSSLWEGLQATLIEAMALGCPVVGTDCPGGARETLEDGKIGPLVPVCSPDRMASAILSQLESPPDPQILAASAARFSIDGKAEQYLELFDSIERRVDAQVPLLHGRPD